MSDYGGTFEKDFFPNTKTVRVEVGILNDLWEDLQTEFVENDLEPEEGLRFALAAGLVSLRAERLKIGIDSDADPESHLERLLGECRRNEGQLAVMRYRAYQFFQDAKRLSMKLNACRQERDGLAEAIKTLQEELRGKS